jgi:hypothetical protein
MRHDQPHAGACRLVGDALSGAASQVDEGRSGRGPFKVRTDRRHLTLWRDPFPEEAALAEFLVRDQILARDDKAGLDEGKGREIGIQVAIGLCIKPVVVGVGAPAVRGEGIIGRRVLPGDPRRRATGKAADAFQRARPERRVDGRILDDLKRAAERIEIGHWRGTTGRVGDSLARSGASSNGRPCPVSPSAARSGRPRGSSARRPAPPAQAPRP